MTTHQLHTGENVVANYEMEAEYVAKAYEKVANHQTGAVSQASRVRQFSYVQVSLPTDISFFPLGLVGDHLAAKRSTREEPRPWTLNPGP